MELGRRMGLYAESIVGVRSLSFAEVLSSLERLRINLLPDTARLAFLGSLFS